MNNMKFSAKDFTGSVRKRAVPLGVALLVLVSAAAGFVGGWAGSRANHEGAFDARTSQQIVLNESELISKIAKDVGPSVVSVNVTSRSSGERGFFGLGPTEQQSAGTGFIVGSSGLIVTNRHVVSDGGEVTVTLADGTELTEIEIVGKTGQGDPLDVAFLKIKDTKGKALKPVKLGDSSKMEVGDKVVAIGNALGQFQNSVTTGIISGYGRDVQASDSTGFSSESLQNLFQTDAAINQGNSGGPLVNINGEVIGINTAVAGEGAENIGFAIPINDAKGLIDTVLAKGKLERPYLGVRYVSLTDDYAYELNLDTKRGAYVAPGRNGQPSILENSPAQEAGLKEKDIITKVQGEQINEKNSLTSLVGKHQVGEEVTLTIIRDGKEQEVKVRLKAAPES
ncbi:MAG TPA: trypsin-like peptidase domain-containing protein [Candidatus Limnocylindria bacterium]|nr:trypsin-like peptidase domain-containing protein [Candidatus Limnocylindria bacterium]